MHKLEQKNAVFSVVFFISVSSVGNSGQLWIRTEKFPTEITEKTHRDHREKNAVSSVGN